MSDNRPTCPDGGKCHHGCKRGDCWRVDNAGPLSGVYPHDEWPDSGTRIAIMETVVAVLDYWGADAGMANDITDGVLAVLREQVEELRNLPLSFDAGTHQRWWNDALNAVLAILEEE